jgi:hypothetical protein
MDRCRVLRRQVIRHRRCVMLGRCGGRMMHDRHRSCGVMSYWRRNGVMHLRCHMHSLMCLRSRVHRLCVCNRMRLWRHAIRHRRTTL